MVGHSPPCFESLIILKFTNIQVAWLTTEKVACNTFNQQKEGGFLQLIMKLLKGNCGGG